MAACRSSIEEGGFIRRWRFWVLALLWLPAGVVAVAAGRFGEDGGSAVELAMGLLMVPMMVVSLVPVAPCGLPLALGCRQLWRLGYRRAAWMAGIGLGAATVVASLVAGLLGPVAIAVYAAVLSMPVWIAWYWLLRRG